MDIVKSLSDSVALVAALVSDIEAAVKAGGGLLVEGSAAIEAVLADEKVRASLSALIADLKA